MHSLLQAVNFNHSRLLSLVEDLLPYFQLKNVHDIVGFGHRKTDFLGEISIYTTDFHDITSEWIEDTLAETFHKRAKDNEKDRELLFLFRLLAVKMRIHYPLINKKLRVDENILLFLERWICQAFVECYLKYNPEKTLKDV